MALPLFYAYYVGLETFDTCVRQRGTERLASSVVDVHPPSCFFRRLLTSSVLARAEPMVVVWEKYNMCGWCFVASLLGVKPSDYLHHFMTQTAVVPFGFDKNYGVLRMFYTSCPRTFLSPSTATELQIFPVTTLL